MGSVREIREAYDENYRQIIATIQQMGGNEKIKSHRSKKSPLYKQLKDLQRREHYLDELENRLHFSQPTF